MNFLMHLATFLRSVFWWLALLLRIRKALALNTEAYHPEVLSGFPQALQVNALN
jgi:hypothetical protein